MEIKITADRMIDLPKEELDRLNISTMSCYVSMGGKSYEDLIDIFPDDIFRHLRETGELAQTAAKSPNAYYEFFKPFTGKNKAVIHFAATSGISSICGYAIEAAKRLPDTYVVDTHSLSNGIALLAGYAIELIENGETNAKKIYELCMAKREKLQSSFLIDTLECLYKGGRCSSLQYFAANILKIKPVITIEKSNGKMVTREKYRGNNRKALAEYIRNTFKKYPNPDLKHLYVIHYCKDEELIKYFIETVTSYHPFETVHMGLTGCNCAIHAGPNTFGFFYFVK